MRTHFVLSSSLSAVAYPAWLLVSLACAPFYILYVAARNVYFKFRHRRARRKNIYRRQLQKSEYLWGISRTAEAGLESCGQLILQVWLLSSDFKSLSKEDFASLVDKTYNGFIFFLTFGLKPADTTEKSLGKMFMSLLALVFGVAACYRTLKRGAVKMSNTFFIYISLFLQVFARIFSIGLYFFAVRDFLPTIPLFLLFHFAAVFAIKWTFERARHTKGGVLTWLVSSVNVFASSLVYVRIVPIEKQRHSNSNNNNNNRPSTCADNVSHPVEQHSTFFVQSLFFALVLLENLLMASVPLFYRRADSGTNRAVACLGRPLLWDYIFRILLLCVASWVFHALYYKYMGHPWSDINGPDFSGGHLRFYFHFCGKERLFDCSCAKRAGGEEPGSRCRGRHLKMACQVQEEDYCFPPLEEEEEEAAEKLNAGGDA